MANLNTFLQAGSGRVWLQRGGPGNAYQLLSAYGAGQVQRPRAAPTPYYTPDPAKRNNWLIQGETIPPPGLVTTTLDNVYSTVKSVLLALDCPAGLQFRYGACDRPDIPSAWDKILDLPGMRVGNWTLNPNIARDPTNQALLVETGDITARDVFEALKLTVTRITVTEVQNANTVFVSRNADCGGICGPAVEIADDVYFGGFSALYGTANLQVSSDGGGSFAPSAADPFGQNLAIMGGLQLGGRIIVISDSNTPTLAYSDDSGATWTTVTYSGGAVGDLADVFALDWGHVYLVGDGGHIFFSDDGGGSIAIQDNASATTENLNKVRVLRSLVGYAVGDNDTILKTSDGATWAAAAGNTGSGDDIIALGVVDENRLLVGTSGGELFVSVDGGDTFAAQAFSGSGAGAVRGIDFVPDTNGEYGFMIHDSAVPVGTVFRTIDGGASWDKLLTVGNGSIGATPTNAGLNDVVAVGVNSAFAVGAVQGGTAFVVKAE